MLETTSKKRFRCVLFKRGGSKSSSNPGVSVLRRNTLDSLQYNGTLRALGGSVPQPLTQNFAFWSETDLRDSRPNSAFSQTQHLFFF